VKGKYGIGNPNQAHRVGKFDHEFENSLQRPGRGLYFGVLRLFWTRELRCAREVVKSVMSRFKE